MLELGLRQLSTCHSCTPHDGPLRALGSVTSSLSSCEQGYLRRTGYLTTTSDQNIHMAVSAKMNKLLHDKQLGVTPRRGGYPFCRTSLASRLRRPGGRASPRVEHGLPQQILSPGSLRRGLPNLGDLDQTMPLFLDPTSLMPGSANAHTILG